MFPTDYSITLFDRRFRFNVARLRLVWGAGEIDWRALFDLLDLSPFDRAVMRGLGRLPAPGGGEGR